ncbi:ABC transporter ATP-binding protein [Rhodopila globiformis]|uniref:ABC transporter ATP-binding protein n=2 Tax=Rhodopila globiformis TaxID=1071 RepID=A0A2S6NH32_RHOGL|nr:ABC transporter ATP-binding protein [Rhodopila globiformis]
MRITVPRQGAVAVLGRNGAGKSTLLKTLAGELRPMAGSIIFDGSEAGGESTEQRARRGIGFVPQEDAIFGKLTVRENLLLGATYQRDRYGIDEVLDFFPKLAQRLGQTAATLSGGERKMLAISRALVARPRMLMLDEPTEGVWIGVIEEIAERLAVLAQRMSVVLVEQHVDLALRVARYAYVMDRGSVALEGPASQVGDDPRLLRYLAP